MKETAVVPVRFAPVIVTDVPAPPDDGVKPEIVAELTVNALDVAVPPGVVTEMAPVVVPFPTTAVICVELLTTNEDAPVPLNVTALAPVKFPPVIVTDVPAPPEVGGRIVVISVHSVRLNMKRESIEQLT